MERYNKTDLNKVPYLSKVLKLIRHDGEILTIDYQNVNGLEVYIVYTDCPKSSIFKRYHKIVFRDVTDSVIYYDSNITGIEVFYTIESTLSEYKINLTNILKLLP